MSNLPKRYNILHLIDTTGHGGAETVLKTLVCGLDRSRFQSYVLLSDYGWLYDQLTGKPDVTVIVFNGKGRLNFSLLHKLGKVIRKYKIDLIHTHLFGSSFYGSLASFLFRVPVVATFHGIPDWHPEDLFNKLKLYIIYGNAKATIFVSEYLKRYFEDIASRYPKNSLCIYNGVSLPKNQKTDVKGAKQRLGFAEEDTLITSVGNIKPIKGYDILLRAARTVLDQLPDIKFVVAGAPIIDDDYQNLLRLRSDLELDGSFFFIGYQENPEIVLKASDLFVLSSISEGFSLSIVEAMAHKLPIVATKSGGPEEILENDITGRLVAHRSSTELGQSIIEVMRNRKFKRTIAENGYRCFLNKFSEARMIQQYQELYTSSTNK